MIFRQTDLNNEKINDLKSIINILDNNYKDPSGIPRYISQIRTIILNYFSMSHTVEQFISRTNLELCDKSYLYLFYEENINISFKLMYLRYSEQTKTMGSPKSIKETLIQLYNEAIKSENTLIPLEEYLIVNQYLISTVRSVGEARTRLKNPNYKRTAFKFDDELG